MKNIFIAVSMLLFLTGCCSEKGKQTSTKDTNLPDGEYQLVWSDEFEYKGLPDSIRWAYDTEGNSDGWGNHEAQFYTMDSIKNAYVGDSTLKIVAHKELFGDKEYTSARLMSKVDWKYGKIEVNAKLPKGRGTWAAIWMMPSGWTYNDGNWPDIGEIDIMEHVGHELGVIHASAHSKDYQWQNQTQKTAVITVADVDQSFHSYTLEWTPDILSVFADDSLYFTYQNEGLGESKWPYDKPFYLILNLAVGGAWGGMQGIDKESFPQTMEVDYVRVYQKTE